MVKIEDIKAYNTVNVKARILAKGNEKIVSGYRGTPLRVCTFDIGDETGIVKLSLFNEDIDSMSNNIGEVISISEGWAKYFQGKVQLSLGKSGTIAVLSKSKFPSKLEILEKEDEREEDMVEEDEEDPDKEAPILKVSQILPNMSVSTTVRVCDKKNIKYLRYKSGKNLRLRTFILGDESGVIPYAAYNEEINTMDAVLGDVIEMKNCWAKIWKNSLQLSKGRRGTWEVVKRPKFVDKKTLVESYNMTQLDKISELLPGKVYYSEIVGIKYQSQGKQIYDEKARRELKLIPEPENPYDNKAVGIWLKDKKVGYIPKKQNKAIFKAIKDGEPELACFLGIYVPSLESHYCIPHKLKNVPVTISTMAAEIEWRPVIIYPEDLMAF